MGNLHINQLLRILRAAARQFRGLLSGFLQRLQKLQCRQFAVTGGGEGAENRMTGLFTADVIATFQHFFQHMAITYGCANQIQSIVTAKFMQAQVGHHRGYNGVAAELTLAFHAGSTHSQHLIAVNGITLFIHQQTAISVTIECNAQIVTANHHTLGQRFQMCGAAAVVDVDAIGCHMYKISHQRQHTEELRRRGRGRAVGAVYQNTHTGQIAIDGRIQMMNIVFLHLAHAVITLADLAMGFDLHGSLGKDQLLHTLFRFVRKLIALCIKDLDAVMFIRIVRGRNHDTGIRLFLHRQERHSRRRDRAKGFDITAHRADTCHQSGLQHIRRNACILADCNNGLTA